MIVLLTDFGPSEYVGVMKGVICSICKTGNIVDLCHNITPQNIIEASWILKSNYKYFPEGSVFCCVVDPGVGTDRKAIAVKTAKYYFVGPDNGMFWEALSEQEIVSIRILDIPENAARTFHGRDIFAVAAAKIDIGCFDTIGPETKDIVKMEIFRSGNEGIVVRIDTFGNIITNIAGSKKDKYIVVLDDKRFEMNFCRSYASAKENELFVIEGSSKTLEISLKKAAANDLLKVKTGQRVIIS